MPPVEWRRYIAPAAFLFAVTIAVILIRSGLDSGRDHAASQPTLPSPPVARVTTTAATTTARTTTSRAATGSVGRRYWTVRVGDTFSVISRQSGVAISQIEQLNPAVSSTALHIGQKVRIR